MENTATVARSLTNTLQERRAPQSVSPTFSGTTRKIKKNLFLRFREVKWRDTKRWEATRRFLDGKTLLYIADKFGIQPTTSVDTWMCEPVRELSRNGNDIIILVRLISKTALVFGREQVFAFYNGNPNNGFPFWKHVEKLSGNTKVVYVPLEKGAQPTIHSPRWLVREIHVCRYKENGRFQVIAVRLIKSMPENFSSKERRDTHKREKKEHIQKHRDTSKW